MLEVRGDYPAALDYYQQVIGPGHHRVSSHIISLLAEFKACAAWVSQAYIDICFPSTYMLDIVL
eukprot:scaffold171356_cov33-Prasinocladus_malaysianus.AAC.1